MPSFEHLEYGVSEHVAEITMAREPVNAITHELAGEVVEAYRAAKRDDDVRAVILTSAFERAFSAGTDIEMASGQTVAEHREYLETLYFGIHDLQYRMGKPTIAAVTGPAVAAGVTLAVTCNCVVANEEAELRYPEVDVGLIPAMHLVHLPRQIGRHKAFELLFSGEPIPATEAERLGVVNRTAPPGEVKAEARDLARTFAEKPPDIMEVAHNAYMRVQDADYRREIEHMVDTVGLITGLDSSREGRSAFVEDRDAEW